MAIQFNFYLDKGGFVDHGDGTFSVDVPKMEEAVKELDHVLLTLEAEGNYAGAKKLQDDMGNIRPPLQKALDRLQAIPADIEPIYVTAERLTSKRN
jgi:hypothetical protein